MLKPSASDALITTLPKGSRAAMALADILDGAQAWRLWWHLGWHSVRQQYRRSIIGPLWITLSMGVLVGSLGFLYTYLFHQNVSEYLPYLACGFILWHFISGLISEGSVAFISESSAIRQIRLPLSCHVFKVVLRNLIIFFHHIWIFIFVMIIFRQWPGWTWLLAVPGLGLLALNGLWVGLLFGTISARFRDVPPIVASIVQIAFFLTPILWLPDMRPGLFYLVNLNPFHHLIHIVREPLLGQVPGLYNWLAAGGITISGWIITFLIYCRLRGRIAYWV